jgi:hypothetical protein
MNMKGSLSNNWIVLQSHDEIIRIENYMWKVTFYYFFN